MAGHSRELAVRKDSGRITRKTCKSCGCDRLQHAVYHEELGSVRDRLGLKDNGPRSTTHHTYDWAPPGLTAKQTELYWSALGERTPTVPGGISGAAAWREWRTRALALQLPRQDLSLAHCRYVSDAHRKQYEDFVAARNEIALDIGVACQHHGSSVDCFGCHKVIRSGNIVIQAPRIEEEALYHPACFTCAECNQLLVELAYCALDGRLYCARHYAERLKPRCHACDEKYEIPPPPHRASAAAAVAMQHLYKNRACIVHGCWPRSEGEGVAIAAAVLATKKHILLLYMTNSRMSGKGEAFVMAVLLKHSGGAVRVGVR
ncbi:Protein prickle [Eumeta japonica]|uniref:Protein prickle n=1 Tax=Eumeta variegata TaxID=151549 RepID=A0A4C1ZB52_EUMVA|nr:Protein prickle [Eumeta japonica]